MELTLKRIIGKCLYYIDLVKKRPIVVYSVLLAFGAVFAFYLISGNLHSNIERMQSSFRLVFLERAAGTLERPIYFTTHQPAYYYYLIAAGKIFGITKYWQLFVCAQMAVASITIIVYPALMYKLSNSLIVAGLTPFLLDYFLGNILYGMKYDQEWAIFWPVILGVPIAAVLFTEKWSKKSWWLYSAACLVVMIGNVPRTLCSLPLTVLLLVFLFVKVLKKPERSEKNVHIYKHIGIFIKRNVAFFIAIVLLLVSQALLSEIVPRAVFPRNEYGVLGPWHALYIGFGWEENKYGIEYRDGYAREKAESINPDVEYLSKEYNKIIRQEYFKILKEDPGYFFGSYLRKFVAIMQGNIFVLINSFKNTVLAICMLLFSAICALYTNKRYRVRLALPLCALCSVFTAMITPMIATPGNFYSYGTRSATLILGMVVVIAVLLYITRTLEEKMKALNSSSVETLEVVGGG